MNINLDITAGKPSALCVIAVLKLKQWIIGTSLKNILTSSGRPHMVLYVTPMDASVAGRPWDVLNRSV